MDVRESAPRRGRLFPFQQKGLYLGGAVVAAFLELAGLLSAKLASVRIQHNQYRQAKSGGITVFLYDLGVVAFIDIDEDQHVVAPDQL